MTQLLLAAALTAAVETLFLAAVYRRGAAFLGLCAAVNVASNLTLTSSSRSCRAPRSLGWSIPWSGPWSRRNIPSTPSPAGGLGGSSS